MLTSDTLGPAGLPISPRLAAAFAVLGYLLVVIASGASDHPRSDLVALPLLLAAALLPSLSALVVGAVVVTIALGPVLANWATTDGASVHVVSVGVIVAASLALRAAMAGLTIARAGQLDEARRTAERMDSVLDIAQRLTRTFDRKAIFETIVTELRRALAVDVATIRVLVGDQLPVAAWAGIPDDLARRLPVYRRDSEWFTEISRSARPLVSDDAAADVERAADYRTESAAIELASILSVPLFDSGAVIGALSVATVAPRHWTAGDVELVSAIATHASIAIRNAELFERTETRAAQLGVLQAASARMSRQNTIDSVGRAIVEETRRILDYHNARVYVLEPPDDLVPIAFEGRVGAYEKVDLELLRTKVGQGFTGWAAAHDEALLIGDANADPRGSTIPGTDDVDESMLVVPMTYDGEVVGVITLSKLGLDQFDADDRRLLTILADQAATALESARLLTRSRQLTSELGRLLEMSGELAHSLDPRQVAATIARHVAGAMAVDRCIVSSFDRAGDSIVSLGTFPPTLLEHVEPAYPLGAFPETRRVLAEQGTVVVDVDDPGADGAEVALLRAEGNATLAMLPLVANGASIGLIELLSVAHVTFDAARLELARTMVNEAAIALENAHLYEAARDLADHDQLTGFYNHRYLHERLGEEIVRAQRNRSPLGLLMIDLDDFKLVNDTFGHLFGDSVLSFVAELIRSTLRASDVPARYGGDEFAVILPETDHDAAERAAARIAEACHRHPFESDTRGSLPIGLSIGVGTFPADGRTGQEVIAAADRALYRAKGDGYAAAGPTPERFRTVRDEVGLPGR